MFCQDKWLLRDLPWCDLKKVCLVGYFTTNQLWNGKKLYNFYKWEGHLHVSDIIIFWLGTLWSSLSGLFEWNHGTMGIHHGDPTDFLVWPWSKGHFPTVGGRRGAPLGENTRGEVDATKVVLRLLICLKRIAVEISMETCLLAFVCTIASEIASGFSDV